MKTDKLIEQIKADREAGTPGPWRLGSWGDNIFGTSPEDEWLSICRVKRDDALIDESKDGYDARRIARVPYMEARILADAEALKAADEKLAKIHAVSMAYAEWVGEVSEILEEMCLDPEDDDHARVIQLLCQAEAGLAKEALVAYNAKFGERE